MLGALLIQHQHSEIYSPHTLGTIHPFGVGGQEQYPRVWEHVSATKKGDQSSAWNISEGAGRGQVMSHGSPTAWIALHR